MKSIDEGVDKCGTLVFIHGWPDSPAVFENQARYFKEKGYRCIRVCLPNFDGDITHPWGMDFDEMTEEVRKLIMEKVPRNEKVNLIIHDWGSLIGCLFEMRYGDMVNRVVSMDVSVYKPKRSILGIFFMIFYQWSMAFAFLFRLNFLQKAFMRVMKAPGIAKGSNAVITSYMAYPYYYFWKRILFSGEGRGVYGLDKYKPTHPHLFLYGDKPSRPAFTRFHSQEWLDLLVKLGKEDGKTKAVPLTKSDHWLQVREPDRVNELIEIFLNLI